MQQRPPPMEIETMGKKDSFNTKLASVALLAALVLALFVVPVVADSDNIIIDYSRPYADDRILLRYDTESAFTVPDGWDILDDYGSLVPGLVLLKLPENVSVRDAIDYFGTLDGVMYAEPDYQATYGPSPTNAKTIFESYRTDRLLVYYPSVSSERLPWVTLYELTEEMSPVQTFGPYVEALVEIPDGMTLREAIEYCDNLGYGTKPSMELIRDADNSKNLDVVADEITVYYRLDSSFRLPWEVTYEDDNRMGYFIPDGMSLSDAIKYCGTIDDITSVSLVGKVYAMSSPFPFIGVIIALFGVCLLVIKSRRK